MLLAFANRRPCAIYCDSQYVVNGFNQWGDGWLASNFKNGKIKFSDLWREALQLRQAQQEIRWVKAHAGTLGNEHADRLADHASQQQRNDWELKNKHS